MKTSIFLKTYRNDLVWLPYLFRSIDKYLTGFERMVIITDNDSEKRAVENMKELPKSLQVAVASCNKPHDFAGYVWQQFVKLKAFDYIHDDIIVFVDSDCVFKRPINPNDIMVEGKPLVLKTAYSEIGHTVPWQPITEQACGFKVDWEYMRRLPFVFRRDSLINAVNYKPDLFQYIKDRSDSRAFSEFNYIGAYVEKFEPEKYHFHDTAFGVPDAIVHQGWSWGGLTDSVKKEIENLIKLVK